MDALPSLRLAAARRLPDGRRSLLPVFGSGINRQACPGAQADPSNSWDALLTEIQEDLRERDFEVPRELPRSAIASWETLLRAATVADEFSQPAHRAEAALQEIVQRRLIEFEELSPTRPFYAQLLAPNFADVLSLNFDRSLARAHGGGKQMSVSPWGSSTPNWGSRTGRSRPDASLFRHDLVEPAPTRIWYPHGDTARRESTKLGVRAYGRYLGQLDRAYVQFQARRRRWLDEDSRGGSWDEHLRSLPARELDWASLFLTAPLVFVGTQLRGDEWGLWWLLHQRARLHARAEGADRPGAWLLLAGEPVPENLVCEPAGLRVLQFDDHAALWQTWTGLFTAP